METLTQNAKRHPVLFLAGYFLVYNIVFWFLEAWNRPIHIVHCRLDDFVPFCSWAVIPYVLWFAWVPAVLLMFYRHSAEAFWRLFGAMSGGIVVALLTYIVYPTGLNLRRPVTGSDPCSRLVGLLYETDTPTNVCPSLHVFITLTLFLALVQAPWVRSVLFRWGNTVIALSICASTVLIDQHSLIDVACGAVLACAMYALHYRTAPAEERQPIRAGFVSRRKIPARAALR